MRVRPTTFENLNRFMTSGLLKTCDDASTARLFSLLINDTVNSDELADAISEALKSIDWTAHAEEIGGLATQLLPVEELLPSIYADWRPIVRDSIAYIVGHLPPQRIIPKIVEQIIRAEQPLEKRVIAFISQMPTLQKMGQIIARNRNLNPKFRNELTQLENSIRDIDPQIVLSTLSQKLGQRVPDYQIELGNELLSEASVSAVVGFTYMSPNSQERQKGVFKIIKPHIAQHFWEEMDVLSGLVNHIETRSSEHVLKAMDLQKIVDDIRAHLTPELDLKNEQQHLRHAYCEFKDVTNIRIPTLIPELSNDAITAMSYEAGCKVTDAYLEDSTARQTLAEQVTEALIAHPMLCSSQFALLHADPHAGNLLADESTNDLVILDWALVERLSNETRRQILRFISAFALRDENMAIDAISNLSQEDIENDERKKNVVIESIQTAINSLPHFQLPRVEDVTRLIDSISMSGVRFDKALLVFRKNLLTLVGILEEIAPGFDLRPTLIKCASKEALSALFPHSPTSRFPLTMSDALDLSRSSQWLGLRLQLNYAKRLLEAF